MARREFLALAAACAVASACGERAARGEAAPPGISKIVGGGPDEVFVGYFGIDEVPEG